MGPDGIVRALLFLYSYDYYFGIFDLMEETKKEKSSKLFAIRDYVLIGLIALAIFFYKDVRPEVINYPAMLIPCAAIVIAAVVVIWRFKKFESKYIAMLKTADRLFYAGVCIVVLVIGSWTMASMVLIPFNYYNIHIAQRNKADTVLCNIENAIPGKIGEDATPNRIDYDFQGKINTIETAYDTPLIANMHELNIYSQFELKLTVHKALLGSYWLQDWKIQRKPVKILP